MRPIRRSLLCIALCLAVLTGCGSEDHETVAPKAAGDTAGSRKPADPFKGGVGTVPVTVAADALTVGTVVAPTGAVTRAPGPFAATDTVHVSFPMQGFDPSAPVVVYWTYQDGLSHHEERTTLPAAGEYAHYSFSADKGMKAGKYNVEVQVKGRPIGIADFQVQ